MRSRKWLLLVAANALCYCVLSFYQTGHAQQAGDAPEGPFANSVAQRSAMVEELREIKALLKEQNALLQSGKVKVLVTLPEKN